MMSWIIVIVGGLGIGYYGALKGWSKPKRWGALALVIIISSILGGGGSNPYYDKGYDYGFEEGKKAERYGGAYASQVNQINDSRYNFFRKYSFSSEKEQNEALKEYIKGYQKGYKDGWED